MKNILKFLAPFFAMNAYSDFKKGVTGKESWFFEDLFVGLGTAYALEETTKEPISEPEEEPLPEEVTHIPSRPVAVSKNPGVKHIKDYLKK